MVWKSSRVYLWLLPLSSNRNCTESSRIKHPKILLHLIFEWANTCTVRLYYFWITTPAKELKVILSSPFWINLFIYSKLISINGLCIQAFRHMFDGDWFNLDSSCFGETVFYHWQRAREGNTDSQVHQRYMRKGCNKSSRSAYLIRGYRLQLYQEKGVTLQGLSTPKVLCIRALACPSPPQHCHPPQWKAQTLIPNH